MTADTNEQKVIVNTAPDATMQDLIDAFNRAAGEVVHRGVTTIINGEHEKAESTILIRRVNEDAYLISGFSIGNGSAVGARLDEVRRHSDDCVVPGTFLPLVFQHGARSEVGFNGITIESLLSICLDRLMCLNVAPYTCGENDLAIKNIAQALDWLNERTSRRLREGRLNTQIPDDGDIANADMTPA